MPHVFKYRGTRRLKLTLEETEELTIQKNWQHWLHKTHYEDKQQKKTQQRKLKR